MRNSFLEVDINAISYNIAPNKETNKKRCGTNACNKSRCLWARST